MINAISSLIIVNGKNIVSNFKNKDIKKKSNYIILFLCFLTFLISSKGYSILYLFLLADLFCCAAVITIFYGFFSKKIKEEIAIISIISGLFSGILFFPSQSFQSSILVGNLISKDFFNEFILTNLLFISFILATLIPLIIIYVYSLRNSFR